MKYLLCILLLSLSATATTIYWQDYAKGIAGWGGYGLSGSLQGGDSVNVPVMPGSVTDFMGSISNLLTLKTVVGPSSLGLSLFFNASGQWTQGSGLLLTFALFGPGGITNLSSNIPGLTAANFHAGFSPGGSENFFVDLSGLKFNTSSYIEFTVPQVPLIPEPGSMILLGTGIAACILKRKGGRPRHSPPE
jgi:hypothetical protein